ncbi:MAG: ExbD/TolR family protein [Sphingomonadales bacterium]|nr:biopolymer transporter ExbD [Sphingomonadales bacterium]
MAQIQESGGGGHGKGGKKRAKKSSTHVDMTPMVDLAFLLLTFFVLTSTFSKPKVLRMIFPEKLDKIDNVKAPEVKDGLTLLLTDKDKIYYYRGSLKPTTELIPIDYTRTGLRKVLVDYNSDMLLKLQDIQKRMNKVDEKDTAAKRKLDDEVLQVQTASKQIVLVKNDEGATYRNMIDVMDEFMITQIAKYFVIDEGMAKLEKDLIKKQGN